MGKLDELNKKLTVELPTFSYYVGISVLMIGFAETEASGRRIMFSFRNGKLKTCWGRLGHSRKDALLIRKCESLTSGIIVTGDEVLKGQVLDTNSYFLCKKLYEIGIKVLAVSKVSDDIDIISSKVKEFSEEFDYVLTTGGVGPTHDDVTYEAVAKAFNDRLFYHPELSKLVLDFFKTNDTGHPALKMACIPTLSKLTFGTDPLTNKRALYPNVSVNNVFMFPGVPHLCERLFTITQNQLFQSKTRFHLRELYLTGNETKIVGALNSAVEKYPKVLFGSYPKFFHSYYDVKISVESLIESQAEEAFQYLQRTIPKEFHIHYDENPFVNKREKISQQKDRFLLETLNDLRNFLKGRNPDDIFLYFDGGKNSTLLLYILSALYEELFPDVAKSVNAIYVEKNPLVSPFVESAGKRAPLNLLRFTETNFRSFATSDPRIFLVKGTRESDPDSRTILEYFDGLPVYNPLARWRYKHTWKIIRALCLPYCPLYDQGYTSVCQQGSLPNPHLRTSGPRTDLVYYKKAFELEDEALENAH